MAKSKSASSRGGKGDNRSAGGGTYRSAITGRYVKPAAGARHPKTTVKEKK